MADPVTLMALIALFTKNTSSWLIDLRGIILDQAKEVAVDKGKERVLGKGNKLIHRVFRLDEKEQIRHLEQVLANAAERAITHFQTLEERDRYRTILSTLTQIGPQSEALRKEALRLLTLSEVPDFKNLNERYNQRQRISATAHNMPYEDIDIAPYLISFFNALISELYADPFFRSQMSESLQLRAMRNMQQSLIEVVNTLRQINETVTNNYTADQFTKDVKIYIAYTERIFHYLKIVGIVPKDHNEDPELDSIFVPLRIKLQDSTALNKQQPDAIVPLLEQSPYLVLLGAPGSGKSTATRYLAWSHAVANLSCIDTIPLLPGRPLPLRIELRRLNAERRHTNYSFLSYTTEVLLRREGVEISQQMFEELLKRRSMLLLFDGLDEVPTLSERSELVEEIEHFAMCYPGNRIVVTSRPTGYDLARLSNQFFAHAQVQDFNDEQIHHFLEKWYKHVLHLSMIPYEDLQELATLFEALKDNPRLHKLAVNPMLLTVITALHRYQRLPDRRVLIYDECAKLLLENWAKLKGTAARWKDMRMGQEDQYICVAHLGFFLHNHSQEQETDKDLLSKQTSIADVASDVPTKVMLREIECFLREQNLIMGVAEQRVEAARFLELMQVEAGMIVERGKDENDEDLYGFVHRTFQEYFAAVDVYERYQQEEDATVISEFLREHLHDPHWREAILLLLGKLKRKPITAQLRQLVEGKLQSRRSAYNPILQQDLFFVCDCLLEEITVENVLAELIVSRLSNIIINSPIPDQKKDAIQYLAGLVSTRQYSTFAVKELISLSTREDLFDVSTRIQIATSYYKKSPVSTRKNTVQILFDIIYSSEAPYKSQINALGKLYHIFSEKTEEKQSVAEKLLGIVQDTTVSVEVALQAAEVIYQSASSASPEKGILKRLLVDMTHRIDMSLEQTIKIGTLLYWYSEPVSKEEELGLSILVKSSKETNLSYKQSCNLAYTLYDPNYNHSLFQNQGAYHALDIISSLMTSKEISIEDCILIAEEFSQMLYYSSDMSNCYWFCASLLDLMKNNEISLKQLLQAFSLFRTFPHVISSYEKEASDIVIEKLKTSPSIENMLQVADIQQLFIDTKQEGIQLLSNLSRRTDISMDQEIDITKRLYLHSPEQSEEEKQAIQVLFSLPQNPDLPITQFIEAVQYLCTSAPRDSAKRQVAIQLLLILVQRSDLSIEQTIQAAQLLYLNSSASSDAQQQATCLLSSLAQFSNLSVEQSIQVIQVLYQNSSTESETNQYARNKLWQLIYGQDIALEQKLKALEVFFKIYTRFFDTAKAVKQVKILLQEDQARQYIAAHWQVRYRHIEIEVSNVPFIAEIIQQDIMPPHVYNEMYHILQNLLPQFEKVGSQE